MVFRSFMTPSAAFSTSVINSPATRTSSSDSSNNSVKLKLDLGEVLDDRVETDSGSNCARFNERI
ncbi:hypothetical protein HanIR_Chr14g0714131 [Helianthus annuus]|nr:hypothetical protein HanIR_Chr14g0714131 [Helianthus annuus]